MNRTCIMLLALLCFATWNRVQAEDIYDLDSIPRYVGQEVVIESFKQSRGLYLEPISASLLSTKEITAHNIRNIKEFSALIPNLYMPDYGSKMTSPVYIRGIGSRINAPSVALYVDGVPYFDRASFDVNVNDVESIEVLRGPQGTIYGRNTMGGVINIYTKSPFQFQGTNVNLGAGSDHHYKVGASHYGKASNKLGYSVSANYGHGGGYFKNSFTGKKADPIDEVATRARLSWRVMPRLTMDLTMAYEYSDQDGYPYRVYDVDNKKMSTVDYNEPSYYKRTMSTNGLHVSYVTDVFKLGSQSSFQFMDGKQGLDQDFTPVDKFFVDFYHRQQMYSQEFNIKSIAEDSRYEWQFGVFGFHQNYSQNNDTDYRELKKHALQNVKNPTYGYAIYHQSTVNDLLLKNLSFVFGIRYDWERTKSTLVRSGYKYGEELAVQPADKGRTSFDQVTPKFALNYSFRDNGLTYFSVTRGYKTGGFNTTADEEKDKTFDPEYSWSYEWGAKSSLLNNLLHLDLSLFFIDWHDQQISQKKATGQGNVLRNAGKSQSKGAEFTAQLNPYRNLSMQLAYGYTQATFKDYNEIYNGNYLPMVPKHTFSLSAAYTVDVNEKWLDDILFNAQYMGMGRIYWNDANTVSQGYYDQVNAKVTFRKKDVSLDLWTKNITDKKYISYHFATSGVDYVQRGKPFSCGVNVNVKF